MELGPDNHTCQIQSYCAKHLKCSQKCDQNKFSVKCSCYEGWVLEPDGESCRSLGERQSRPRRGEQGGERVRGCRTSNLLQYSCLKIPLDRGTCQAAGHGVAKSWTQLSD